VQPSDPDDGRRTADAGAALTAFLDLDDLLRRAVAYACESAGTRTGRILLHDPEAHEFVVAAASGGGTEPRGRRLPDRGGVLGAVLASGTAQISSDRGAPAIVAPLVFNDRTIGVVEAAVRISGGSFTRSRSVCQLLQPHRHRARERQPVPTPRQGN
jgi:hypothetical protein